MDDFKKLPKMAHFKEGGHAKAEDFCGGGRMKKKAGGKIEHDDEKQDKAMIKKAFKQHDEAEHDKEPTEIKLKKGGRSKKEKGTVRKYKEGGKAETESAAAKRPAARGSDVTKEKGKAAGALDAIKKVPPTGDKKAEAKSGAKGGPNKYKDGGSIEFSPDQDMSNVSPQDVADAKARAKQTKAYNAATVNQ